jgi:mono/diheme cytochrome c family protein
MNGKILMLAGAVILAAGSVWFLQRQGPAGTDTSIPVPEEGAPMVEIVLPATLSAEAQIGKRAFEAICATCHGDNATGRQGMGPPLIHKIYEPGHHADMAFQLAVQNGVRSHHWRFGDMPSVEGLTRADVASIVTYVREVQRENGID